MSKYSSEKNVQQLVCLLKAHNIRRIIVSPGNTNIAFVGSIQDDPFFEIYSCVDERSAVYMACGLAEQSGEAVAISCTGATASRNYPSGLTEAFYKKLPILAITSSQYFGRLGNLYPQFTDRNVLPRDIARLSVQIPYPKSDDDLWSNNVKLNNALLQLKRNGGGPVHINIETIFSSDFSVEKVSCERVIRRFTRNDELPKLNAKTVCIFVGSHRKFSKELEEEIDLFCSNYNGIVLCDHTSNYKGKYRILGGIVEYQDHYYPAIRDAEVTIHIGETSGAYYSFRNTCVWRVNEDGEIRDTFKALTSVFEMEEMYFFKQYNSMIKEQREYSEYYSEWKQECAKLYSNFPELPFSNVWIAQHMSNRLPDNSVLHLGILNSLRSWNMFEVPNSVYAYSNVGGFGIDGAISTCIGASFVNTDKTIHFLVIGDLATFYDINVLGNRHIRNNIRLIVINNGTGFEMHCSGSLGNSFGNSADRYMAAGGHFGKKSRTLLKHIAEDLDFEYIKAESKNEFMSSLDYFLDKDMHEKPLIFEVFINEPDEELAYDLSRNIARDVKNTAKQAVYSVIGKKRYDTIRRIIKHEN